MEQIISQFPSPIRVKGKLYSFSIIKNSSQWVATYIDTKTHEQLVWRWNVSLYRALKLLEGWLRQNDLWIDEIPAIDFNIPENEN